MKQEEKDRINYEIEAKIKAKTRDIAEWTLAIFLGLVMTFIISLILNVM